MLFVNLMAQKMMLLFSSLTSLSCIQNSLFIQFANSKQIFTNFSLSWKIKKDEKLLKHFFYCLQLIFGNRRCGYYVNYADKNEYYESRDVSAATSSAITSSIAVFFLDLLFSIIPKICTQNYSNQCSFLCINHWNGYATLLSSQPPISYWINVPKLKWSIS